MPVDRPNHIVLVHGAWLGAWCWDKVVPILTTTGATVDAVELPGHGKDQTPAKMLSLGSYVDTAERAVKQVDAPVLLVGHSMAGAVISEVAERIPDRIRALVYVAAYLLKDGESIQTVSAKDADSLVPSNMVLAPDYSEASIKPEGLRTVFCADASEADAARLETAARAEPLAAFGTAINITDGCFGKVKRYYVHTSMDRAVTLKLQQQMVRNLPCEKTFQIESSHSPFLSRPKELVEILKGI